MPSVSSFTTHSTSYHSADVAEPIILSETSSTRRIAKATINDVRVHSGETVSLTIAHERKGTKDIWEPVQSVNLSRLKAGEGVRLALDSSQTRRLYDGLVKLYALSEKGVARGKNEFLVAEADRAVIVPEELREYVFRLLQQDYGDEIWRELVDMDPDLATRLALARLQEERRRGLDEFIRSIREARPETYWQGFFDKNQWIFGYGLRYCRLDQVTDQPHFGGVAHTGEGSLRGDYLMVSDAEVRFTVIVEIKTPQTALLSPKPYRNRAWPVSGELNGGIAQLQTYTHYWQRRSADVENESLAMESIYTVLPKSLLIIGNTVQLQGDRSKAESFENYRRNITNPEILTFDELLERAKFIVNNDKAASC